MMQEALDMVGKEGSKMCHKSEYLELFGTLARMVGEHKPQPRQCPLKGSQLECLLPE